MGNVADALIVVGFIAQATGGVLLAINAVRRRFRKTWKRWTVVAVSGLAVMLVGVFVGSLPARFEITSVTVRPQEVMPGETVTIIANVENTGGAEGVYHAVLFVDGVETEATSITLAAAEEETLSFSVANNTPGIHEVKLGQLTDSFEVLAIPKFEIVSCSVEPREVTPEESVTVTVNVENTGEAEGVYHAVLTLDGEEIESKSLTLAAGERDVISFTVSEDMPGIHEIKLGQLAETFEVLEAARFEVRSININPNPVKVGQEITVSVEIENVGETGGTYTASLVVDDIAVQTKDIRLSGGAIGSISFPVTKQETGNYSIEVADQEAILKVIEPVRLDTGTFIVKDLYGGKAKLTVENGLDLDAVVILSLTEEPDTSLVAVYIQSDDSYTIKRIKSGTYILYFCLGKDWDNDSNRFITEATYKRFEDEIKFISSASRYSVVTVTLHTVIGGTAGTEYLSEDKFPKLQ